MTTYRQLIYCSRNSAADPEAATAAIRDILATSRVKNVSASITGALFAAGDQFAQVLEGPAQSVDRLMDAIRVDPRHRDIVVMPTQDVPERSFADWSMAFATDGGVAALDIVTRAASSPDATARQAVFDLVHRSIAKNQIW